MSTLELLPMWGGAEPDTELFASGVVLDDNGEWAGGQSLDAAGGAYHSVTSSYLVSRTVCFSIICAPMFPPLSIIDHHHNYHHDYHVIS